VLGLSSCVSYVVVYAKLDVLLGHAFTLIQPGAVSGLSSLTLVILWIVTLITFGSCRVQFVKALLSIQV
jgi:hypothetical protein